MGRNHNMNYIRSEGLILGGGMTGLAAGTASGISVYESEENPGGICSSYYIQPGERKRLYIPPKNGEAYRFEIGGGHWIFGGDPLVLHFIRSMVQVKTHTRKSAVFLPDNDRFIPYPLQYHLRYLGPELAAKCLHEMIMASNTDLQINTMSDWLKACFGPTLCDLFFYPFHELYTTGLYTQIAPQDIYKSPLNLKLAIQGALTDVNSVGYNVTFIYPNDGLNALAQQMARQCNIHYGKRVVSLDIKRKVICFDDGSTLSYKTLLSTLPLNKMIEITGLSIDEPPDPLTAVLVINMGAKKGERCPTDHWVYIPKSRAGFHRVGFYSNVDVSFLPKNAQQEHDRVSIYVEKAYPEGQKPDEFKVKLLCDDIIQELQNWGWIAEVEVLDPTWIDVAYTWTWPGSKRREKSLMALEEHNIYQVGRYGRWVFQGIADSIRDGLIAGGVVRC